MPKDRRQRVRCRPPRQRLQIGIDVRRLRFRQHGFGIGRHIVRGIAQLLQEGVIGQLGLGEDRRRPEIGAALADAAVAFEAAIGEKDALAIGGIACRRVGRRRVPRSPSRWPARRDGSSSASRSPRLDDGVDQRRAHNISLRVWMRGGWRGKVGKR